jgi:hypothetical protein
LKRASYSTVLFALIVSFFSCKTPPVPSEVERAKAQENDLWRAGAPVYASEEYSSYLVSLQTAKEKLIKQKAKIGWFRKYQDVQAEYAAVLTKGEAILDLVRREKESKSRDFGQQVQVLKERIGKVKQLTLTMNENGRVRKNLIQAEVACQEAETRIRAEKYAGLSDKIRLIESFVLQAEEAVFSILTRYADETQVEKWRKWSVETIAESKRRGTAAIIISKLDRKLTLYKKGRPLAAFEIGLGKYGLSDKLYAGDEATPEGRYKIVKKNPRSRFYKALLIDYPNDDDKKRFAAAKKKGLVSPRASIGGLIEIHGGGKDSLTNGCIAVENEVMDKLFPEVTVGTPVTIIGSVESAEQLLLSLGKS